MIYWLRQNKIFGWIPWQFLEKKSISNNSINVTTYMYNNLVTKDKVTQSETNDFEVGVPKC